MGKCIALICMVLFIGCTTGSTLNIVSPSASEDEVRARAKRVTSEKTPPAKDEKAVPPQQSPGRPQESVAPEKTNPPEESIMKSGYKEEALIHLLEKKGIITRKELTEEIKRLEQGAK